MTPESTTSDAPSRGERTRQELLNAAFELFAQKGFHGTSMRQIAKRADLALGGIYNHFANKEEIFQALLITHHPFVRVFPYLVVAPGDTLDDCFRQAAILILDAVQEEPALLNLALIEMVELQGRHFPTVIREILPAGLTFVEKLQLLDGQPRHHSPIVILQSFLGTLIGHLLTRRILSTSPQTSAQMASPDEFVDLLLYGLIERPATEAVS